MIVGSNRIHFSSELSSRVMVEYRGFIFAHLQLWVHINGEQVCYSESEYWQIYSEMEICDHGCQIQNQLPSRETIVQVLCASDKTHCANLLYHQHAWLLYFTIVNIWKDIHHTSNKYAWVVIGLITWSWMVPNALMRHGIMPLKLCSNYTRIIT